MPTPEQIAAWRYELIAPLLDSSLDRARRRALMREILRRVLPGPSNEPSMGRMGRPEKRRIGRATVFRWIKAYRERGLKGLEPKVRSDQGSLRRQDAEPWIQRGIQLLYEQPERSLTQIALYLSLEFDGYDLSRASLHRYLLRHAAFDGIRALRRRQRRRRLRGSFEAGHAHECWQLDGKGAFPVRFTDGKVARVWVLTVLDDYSRAVLAAVIASSESTEAAVLVLQKAIELYGLAGRMQFDRGSAFDSNVVRLGLARLGIHRNNATARSSEAQGKIEAYHRSLKRWFIRELDAQAVVDREHLAQLLDATLALFYNRHWHRQIRTTPEARLAGQVSERRVAPQDLRRAFLGDTTAKSHPKTGAVRLPNGLFRVPEAYAGKACRFRFDLAGGAFALLVTKQRREFELSPFVKRPLPPPQQLFPERRGAGQLQKLVDRWRGRERPNCEPGFGLPEIFEEIGRLVGRVIPSCEAEALEVHRFYEAFGPLARNDFILACERAKSALGTGRPLSAYVDDIQRQIRSAHAKNKTSRKESL